MHWDKEADVVVVGYGLSGAITAIEASNAGASVLILEKSQYPGGCSILAGGAFLCVSDADRANIYLSRLSGGRVDPTIIRSFAHGLAENESYIRNLAQINGGIVSPAHFGKDDIWWGTYPYPFEGYDSLYISIVKEIPGFNGRFPWLQRMRPAGVNLMKTAMDNVEKRSIEVLFSKPATKIVSLPDRPVAGVICKDNGSEIAIKARRALVLACGGFEQNSWMQMQYLQGLPFFSMAPLTHTGDGILMAQKVGAALWHMWHIHGSYGYKYKEFPIAFRHPFGGARNPKHIMPWIVVDKYGERYMNEYPPATQDTGYRPMEIFNPDMPGYPRIPSFLIFDEEGRKRGRIAEPLTIGDTKYEWSQDNLEELKKGWIVSADSISDLARKIRDIQESESKMSSNTLEATLSRWNNCVKTGEDWLGRLSGTMMPIEVGPFYAVPVWPIITNTQGGPVHNEKQQVLDAFGEIIPHLYCAGELGSFFAHLYQLAGNLGECLSSGRVAGKYSAIEPPIDL